MKTFIKALNEGRVSRYFFQNFTFGKKKTIFPTKLY